MAAGPCPAVPGPGRVGRALWPSITVTKHGRASSPFPSPRSRQPRQHPLRPVHSLAFPRSRVHAERLKRNSISLGKTTETWWSQEDEIIGITESLVYGEPSEGLSKQLAVSGRKISYDISSVLGSRYAFRSSFITVLMPEKL
uniref:Uncharacterized protein n=1 Tax=Oryza sativa subsp. japonica TaxID=39947 RepID=Q2R0X5_ORYSJ|nr:hypothetical protein LOC_Os11g41080 [Oryza sativa Japonica Group]